MWEESSASLANLETNPCTIGNIAEIEILLFSLRNTVAISSCSKTLERSKITSCQRKAQDIGTAA